jgi:ribosomal protein L37AE/L43A
LTFVTLLTLKIHKEGHKKNDCSKCPAKFAKRRQLVNHLKAVHLISTAEKYYECTFCPRRFVKKPSLWFHFNFHVKVTTILVPYPARLGILLAQIDGSALL